MSKKINDTKDAEKAGESRLVFLVDKFGVFTPEDVDTIFVAKGKKKLTDNIISEDNTMMLSKVYGSDSIGMEVVNAIKETPIWKDVTTKKGEKSEKKEKLRPNVRVSEAVFGKIMEADPTDKFVYVQWMLTVYTNLIKNGEDQKASQFVGEDLGMANEYLTVFEKHKRKGIFKSSCKRNTTLPKDPTNINQYISLSQLFDAVDPFLERDTSQLETNMKKYEAAGEGIIAYRDRHWTVWVPLTRDANVIMNPYANWCTAHPGGSYYHTYTSQLRPDGEKSKIYCIINNGVYAGNSDEVYQIHFESKQIKCRRNSSNVDLYGPVLSKSEGISEFFKKELDECARAMGGDITNNMYIDYLIEFGHAESYFDYLDENETEISLSGKKIPKLPNLSKFKKLDQLLLSGISLTDIGPSIGSLQTLELLSLSDNKIKSLPKEIGDLKNLDFLNIKGNQIEHIPEELSKLDESNGGKLYRIAVLQSDIGEVNYQKLKKLLPSVKFGA